MPTVIHPMLATPSAKAFDDPDWLFEIKWDGYRAIAFIEDGRVRLVSRSQNDLTAQFPELGSLPQFIKAHRAILDGEIVALDDKGRPSFSLMQQRTGFHPGKRRLERREGVPVIYYAFDLLYLDGLDLRRVALEQRKRLLQEKITAGEVIQYSDHYGEKGLDLFAAAKKRELEGIVAKKRNSVYEEKRSTNWLKIKITQRQECVIGGYTDPEGSREYFGALVLGLYDRKDASSTSARLVPASIRRRSKKSLMACKHSRPNRTRFTTRLKDCGRFSSCARNWWRRSSSRSGRTKPRRAG